MSRLEGQQAAVQAVKDRQAHQEQRARVASTGVEKKQWATYANCLLTATGRAGFVLRDPVIAASETHAEMRSILEPILQVRYDTFGDEGIPTAICGDNPTRDAGSMYKLVAEVFNISVAQAKEDLICTLDLYHGETRTGKHVPTRHLDKCDAKSDLKFIFARWTLETAPADAGGMYAKFWDGEVISTEHDGVVDLSFLGIDEWVKDGDDSRLNNCVQNKEINALVKQLFQQGKEHQVTWGISVTPPACAIRALRSMFGVPSHIAGRATKQTPVRTLPPYRPGAEGEKQFARSLHGWKFWYRRMHSTEEAQLAAAACIATGVPSRVPKQDDGEWLAYVTGRCDEEDPFYTRFDLTTQSGRQLAISAAKVSQASASIQEVEANGEASLTEGATASALIEHSITNILKPETLVYLTNNARLRKLFNEADIALGGTGTTECENFHAFLMKRLVNTGLSGYDMKKMMIALARIQYTAGKAKKLLQGSTAKAMQGQGGSSILHQVLAEALNLMRFLMGGDSANNHLLFAKRLAASSWKPTTPQELMQMGFRFSIRNGTYFRHVSVTSYCHNL